MSRQLSNAPRVRLSLLQGDATLYGAVHAALGVALTTAGRSIGHPTSVSEPPAVLAPAGTGSVHPASFVGE
jgi:hypothetical protein